MAATQPATKKDLRLLSKDINAAISKLASTMEAEFKSVRIEIAKNRGDIHLNHLEILKNREKIDKNQSAISENRHDIGLVLNVLDSMSKHQDDFLLELAALKSKTDRHERWHQQFAKELNITLDRD